MISTLKKKKLVIYKFPLIISQQFICLVYTVYASMYSTCQRQFSSSIVRVRRTELSPADLVPSSLPSGPSFQTLFVFNYRRPVAEFIEKDADTNILYKTVYVLRSLDKVKEHFIMNCNMMVYLVNLTVLRRTQTVSKVYSTRAFSRAE